MQVTYYAKCEILEHPLEDNVEVLSLLLLATRWLLIEKNAEKKTPQSLERGVFIGGERGT